MSRWCLWVGGIVLFFAIWWNQPYFGWNYCIGKGWMPDEEFLEELRPNLQASTGEEAKPLVNEAIDLMKECITQRGLEYCRYAGPDAAGTVVSVQYSGLKEPDREYKYRYIKNSSNVGISILPSGEISGNFMQIYYYDLGVFSGSSRDKIGRFHGIGVEEIGFYIVCPLGCSCAPSYNG